MWVVGHGLCVVGGRGGNTTIPQDVENNSTLQLLVNYNFVGGKNHLFLDSVFMSYNGL